MTPRTWCWLALIATSLILGCSSLETRHSAGIVESSASRIVAAGSSEPKNALVIAKTSATAKAYVLAASGTVTHDLPILSAVGATLTPQSIYALSQNPQIHNIVIDNNSSAKEFSDATASAAVEWLQREQGAPTQNAWLSSLVGSEKHGLTGRGIGLAIIDTGIAQASENTQWTPNLLAQYDAISDTESVDVLDLTGHGTHLSSLITGMDDVLEGIAPNASLVMIKAFNSEDNANFLDVIRAVQWVTTNKERLGIRVLNLSVSASTELPYFLDPLNRSLTAAWASGLIVVVSAGNEGPAQSTVTSPGNNPWLISVGAAHFDASREVIDVSPFSGRGPTASGHIKPNIVAPGVHLAGFLPATATRPTYEPVVLTESGLWVTSGASQASAVVAGLVTLLLEARPELSNNDVKCLIANSATPLLSAKKTVLSPMAQGRGLINLNAALLSSATDCEERFDGLSTSTAIEGAYPPEP